MSQHRHDFAHLSARTASGYGTLNRVKSSQGRRTLLAAEKLASPVAAIAAAAGLFLTWWAITSSTDDSRAQDQRDRYQTISAKAIELDSTFVEHPELLPYFWQGQEVSATTDLPTLQRAVAVAVQRVDNDAYTYAQLISLRIAPKSPFLADEKSARPSELAEDDWQAWKSWTVTIRQHFIDGPVMCDGVRANRSTYDESFVDALDQSGVCDTKQPPSGYWPKHA